MRKLMMLCAAATVVSGSAALNAQTEPAKTLPPENAVAQVVVDDRYRIGFQDVINVHVYRHPELSGRVAVNPNGTIILFRLEKPIVAVCKTDAELAKEIETAYEEKLLNNAEVKVDIAEQKSQPIAIIGAIEKPGYFPITRRTHLLELLAMAGGPNKESGTRLSVLRTTNSSSCKGPTDIRDDAEATLLNFKIRDLQEGKSSLWMQPGDIVSVLDADVIYVYGNVNKQGVLRVREPLTLTQAIAASEGLKPATKMDKVRILRQRQGIADREEIVVDLNEVNKGKLRDPFLEPNDIVAVSTDKMRAVLLGIANSIKSSVPNVLYRLP